MFHNYMLVKRILMTGSQRRYDSTWKSYFERTKSYILYKDTGKEVKHN